MSVVPTRRHAASGPVSLSYWSDEWRYQKLLESVNIKTVHQKEREEQEVEKKAKEAAKRLRMKVAAAENRQRAILEKKKIIDEEIYRRGRKHKRRAAKKAAKKESDSLMRQIDKELDEVDLEALEEELRVLEEEEELERNAIEIVERKSTGEEGKSVERDNLTEVDGARSESELLGTLLGEFKFLDMKTDRDKVRNSNDKEKSWKTPVDKSKKKSRYRKSASGKIQTRILIKEEEQMRVKEYGKIKEDGSSKEKGKEVADQDMLKVMEEQSIIAANELIEKRRLMAKEEEKLIIDEAKESARNELNILLNDLKSKAGEAKIEFEKAVNKANDAHDCAAIYTIEVARDDREASSSAQLAKAAAEKAKIAAERSRLSQGQYAELLYYEEAMKLEVQIAKETYETFKKDIEDIERLENEMSIKGETEKIDSAVVVNPFLDFIKEAITSKSQDLECPVCLEEATSPIYSCPARGHILCSSCRPAVSWCPECRESLGTEWIRHRFAERTAEELQGLREKLQSM